MKKRLIQTLNKVFQICGSYKYGILSSSKFGEKKRAAVYKFNHGKLSYEFYMYCCKFEFLISTYLFHDLDESMWFIFFHGIRIDLVEVIITQFNGNILLLLVISAYIYIVYSLQKNQIHPSKNEAIPTIRNRHTNPLETFYRKHCNLQMHL